MARQATSVGSYNTVVADLVPAARPAGGQRAHSEPGVTRSERTIQVETHLTLTR